MVKFQFTFVKTAQMTPRERRLFLGADHVKLAFHPFAQPGEYLHVPGAAPGATPFQAVPHHPHNLHLPLVPVTQAELNRRAAAAGQYSPGSTQQILVPPQPPQGLPPMAPPQPPPKQAPPAAAPPPPQAPPAAAPPAAAKPGVRQQIQQIAQHLVGMPAAQVHQLLSNLSQVDAGKVLTALAGLGGAGAAIAGGVHMHNEHQNAMQQLKDQHASALATAHDDAAHSRFQRNLALAGGGAVAGLGGLGALYGLTRSPRVTVRQGDDDDEPRSRRGTVVIR